MGWRPLLDPESRRAQIRRNRPDSWPARWADWKTNGVLTSVIIAVVFWGLATLILMLREEVVPYRPGQAAPHDILARVDFAFADKDLLNKAKTDARENAPRVYRSNGDPWTALEEQLLGLPDKVAGDMTSQLPTSLKDVLDSGTLTLLQTYQAPPRRHTYDTGVKSYVKALRNAKLILLPEDKREEDLKKGKQVFVAGLGLVRAVDTYPIPAQDDLNSKISRYIDENFDNLTLRSKIQAITTNTLPASHVLDEVATVEAQNRAADNIASTAGTIEYKRNQVVIPRGWIDQRDWQLLRAENQAFSASLGPVAWKTKLGLMGITLLLTIVMSVYIAHYQPRVVKNHARAVAIAALLLSMLLLAQLCGIGSGSPLFLFGIAPSILAAIILTIAYDQRFTIGVASVHAMMVTLGLDQGVGFFIVIWVGCMTTCFLLTEIRTRSKLIEVGGLAAMAMIAAVFAFGAIQLDPLPFIWINALYAGAAGLGSGFVVLGILPFIEKTFRITTSMTLLELADASQPLLRRLALEAPGTYNHSLQVATLAESAAEAIGANSLLCRVASYYHDIGKINKADYFVENQNAGENRHINLSPSVSLLIIIGHVKDGIELAKEYNLPTSFFPFIQQHHGTTLVEFFYYQACTKNRGEDDSGISEVQYRYPGPKPKTKEVGILMLADSVEGACRAMPEPTASRIEMIVHEIAFKRLTDGQFDECDLTMRELEMIEKSLVKTLLGIYHGRIAYPTTAAVQAAAAAVRSA